MNSLSFIGAALSINHERYSCPPLFSKIVSRRICLRTVSAFFLLIIGSFFVCPIASASFVTTPALLNATDSIFWSQMGASGSLVPAQFDAVSTNGGSVQVLFHQTSGGTVGVVCPAVDCNFAGAPGFDAGDSLLWTEDSNGNGTGPLALLFPSPVSGAGFYFQLTAPASFSALFITMAGGNSASEIVKSDGIGDPVFLGALDGQADITGLEVVGLSCAPLSPGGCNTSDFAIDTVSLTSVPEPRTLVPMLMAVILFASRPRWVRNRRSRCVSLLLYSLVLSTVAARSLHGQEPVPISPDEAPLVDISALQTDAISLVQPDASAPSFPIWRYQINSPADGLTYSGYMVGTSPFNRGARTTTIQTILVPVVISFNNTSIGFTATFDPSSTPDAGCTAGQTAMSLVKNSPLFQNQDWTLNGVYVGNTQYVDAFQRANFWQYIQNTGDAYHVLLDYSVGDPLFLSLQYAGPTLAAEVRTVVQSSCTNASISGSTNGGSYEGIVDLTTLENAMTGYIASHGITPDKFPIFIVYNVMYSQNGTVYFGGTHFSTATYPQVLTSPGQTFALANFRTNGPNRFDISILSHEIAEWVNDPGGINLTPAWSNPTLGGCQQFLEVGDPLSGVDLPVIAGPNGFTYHLQELAYFSWFFRTPTIGTGNLFSDNGTFTSDAGAVCQLL